MKKEVGDYICNHVNVSIGELQVAIVFSPLRKQSVILTFTIVLSKE